MYETEGNERMGNEMYKLGSGCVMEGLVCTGEKTDQKAKENGKIKEKDAE